MPPIDENEAVSMSTHVAAIRPPDERWEQMKAVWDTCKAAGIQPPREVDAFFEGEDPDPAGVVIDLEVGSDGVREWTDEVHRQGIEVDLSALPSDVRVLRFYNSW